MSKNQVLKKNVDIFRDFVESHFIYENNYFIFNYLTFKKIIYEGQIEGFLTQLKEYYYKNKYFYIERPNVTYNQFNTILRQICKMNNIHIEIKIKFENSKYSPEYHIFLDKAI
jgi:hypothetical protein